MSISITFLHVTAGIIVSIIIITILTIVLRRLRAQYLVTHRKDEVKLEDLNKAIKPFGFQYDLCQDVFFTRLDSWQRNMGYSRIYDQNAIVTNMVINCEPIYFMYNNRSYMVELWKGQYGICTGAEVGFYVTDEINIKHPEVLFYQCVKDEEMLPVRFTLKKKNRILMIRDDIHWWLTGFMLGEFTNPDELTMEVTISFNDYQMKNEFLKALVATGYDSRQISTIGQGVFFIFNQPYTKQPYHTKLRIHLTQKMNKKNCKRYKRVTKKFTRTIDKVDYIAMCFPRLYKRLLKVNRI